MGLLDGRVCLITGAGRGLGREHALLFAREGARVVVNDIVPDRVSGETQAASNPAQAVVDEIQAAGGQAVATPGSVTGWQESKRMIDQAIETFGDLHVVVNNAGFVRDRMLVSMTEQEFDDVIAVHLKGTFNITRWAADYWRQQSKLGSAVTRAVINTSSAAGLHGNVGQTNYAAAKAGIAAMTIVNSMELRRYGVIANCIAPVARTQPVLDTPHLSALVGRSDFDPGNVSPLVAALAAEDCPLTGQVFSVYGNHVGLFSGWSIHREIAAHGSRWGVEELTRAMQKFPERIEVDSQFERLLAKNR